MTPAPSDLLRRALRANAGFSTLSGLTLLLAAAPLGSALGIPEPALLRGIGITLLVFAAGLFRNAARSTIRRGEAALASGLDLAWVAGSGLLLAWPSFEPTRLGRGAIAAVATIVLACALLQLAGLRRLAREGGG